MNITNVINLVAESLPKSAENDLPMIRQALNDSIDQAVRSGEMNEQQGNKWSQDRAVKVVQRLLRAKSNEVAA